MDRHTAARGGVVYNIVMRMYVTTTELAVNLHRSSHQSIPRECVVVVLKVT